jgi:hypothetical protein
MKALVSRIASVVGLRSSDAMKLRHAAALALVGWYLMIPPLYKGGHLAECISSDDPRLKSN